MACQIIVENNTRKIKDFSDPQMLDFIANVKSGIDLNQKYNTNMSAQIINALKAFLNDKTIFKLLDISGLKGKL